MSNLIELVDQVFQDNGVLAQLGGRSVSEQHEYAISIAKSLTHPSKEDRLSLLQADTGIGKTFGYLVPIMIHVATSPDFGNKKYVVSTYTRQLQKQIINEDVPFIHQVLNKLGITNKPTVSVRMGKQGFFSISRVRNHCAKIVDADPTRTKEIKLFLDAVEDICTYGSGMWADYIEEYGDLPKGVTSADVCLLQHQKNDQAAYKMHLEKASLSPVIITNHHSILTPDLTQLSTFNVEAVIVDEAHKISGICQEMFNYRVGFNELTNLLNKASLKSKTLQADTGHAIACISELEQSLKKHPRINVLDYISTLNAPDLFESQRDLVGKLNAHFISVHSKLLKVLDLDNLDNKDAELLSGFKEQTKAIEKWLNRKDNQYQVSAFGISKVRKSLSLATLNVRGSALFSFIIKRISNNVILTSATLSNAQKNLSFSQVQNDLGLRKFEVIEQLSVSPKHYAEMNFVLADKNIPSPVLDFDEDEVIFSPKWLMNTVKMIEKAAEENEPVLVLTVSHAESKLIASKLSKSLKVSLHEKGHSIKEYTNDFTEGKTKILISSAGWEGLNLRTPENKQLIKHIVISRIPFTPPNLLLEYALDVISKTHPTLAIYKKNIEWVEAIQEVVARLKQGFGRGTRSPEDSVLIWIADSRMPQTRSDRNSVLLNAIPSRFLNNYLSAEVFEQQRKEVFFI